jgi:transcriptional regulator with XRE-family HTH domain
MLDLTDLHRSRRLRVLRAAAGLTGWELAAQAGLGPGRLSELETGRRMGTPAEWARLAEALEATRAGLATLLGTENAP